MSSPRTSLPYHKVNGTSNIPRRQVSRQLSNPGNSPKSPDPQAHRWKQKYEESEEKRKLLLTEKEKIFRNLKEAEKQNLNLQIKHEQLETELFEKNEKFTKLTTASKNLYKEYETLKNLYETETNAMSGALKDASQWYKENKELKRRTLLFLDKDIVDEGVDAGETESNVDNDIENLNKTIKQLSSEVAELQTELDAIKQTEFQTTEENINLSEELEKQKKKNECLESQLSEMKTQNDHMLRVMEMMKHELAEYKTLEEEHRTNFAALRKEADTHKRERNVLAHQSTLILQGLSENSDDGSFLLLAEIENLKRTLEDEHNKHEEEINILQERLEVAENNAQVEILEERLKLVESELQAANERARKAEEKVNSPPAPPPLPPPPPPPLLPGCLEPPKVPLRRRRSKPALQELADTIGVQDSNGSEKKGPSAPGVNEDIINAIKAGQFTLRKANKKKEKEEKEEPKAVSEMLNILGSLRCAPKKRKSLHFGKVES